MQIPIPNVGRRRSKIRFLGKKNELIEPREHFHLIMINAKHKKKHDFEYNQCQGRKRKLEVSFEKIH